MIVRITLLQALFCGYQFFRSLNSVSRSVYPFTDGSFEILSASANAERVASFGIS